jgi:hypothetical protein
MLSNPLVWCRRHSRSLARVLLPILLVGSAGAAGSCPVMAAAAADAQSVAHAAHATQAAQAAHAGRHHAHAGHVAHAGHDNAPSAHDDSHDHRDPRSTHDQGGDYGDDLANGQIHDHGACPHCLAESGSGGSDGHAFCAAFDEAANTKHAGKPVSLDLKLALPAELHVFADIREPLVEKRRTALYHRIFPPAVPLNLRHCVFVI